MQNSILQWLSSKMLERTLQPRELLTARKLVYVFLIIVLIFASIIWRQQAVDARAVELAIRQDSRGEVELSGELVRLSLTGLRGIATCVLWNQAIEKQKKNQWNELEVLVRTLTKLQPHFITPWLFQSWNLSYNVSVESDRVNDKYYYVTRGIELLAEGERQNQFHPDLRFSIGFYLQHKIMQSDQTNALRSLFQLSLIPPSERDPDRFIIHAADGSEQIDWVEFEKFVTNHPQLARRLHSGMLRENQREYKNQFTCDEAGEVVRFLRDNWRVPGLYELPEKRPDVAVEGKDVLLPPTLRFPPLPPKPEDRPDLRPNPFKPAGDIFTELDSTSKLDDAVDGYAISRAWFGYAQEPLPEPDELPGSNKAITNRVRQRRPRHLTTLLFRSYPSLTMSSGAERLEQEGWFRPDEAEEKKAKANNRQAQESWEFPENSWFKERGNKFADGKTAHLVLQPSQHADEIWKLAVRMLTRHGEANHLLFEDPKQEAQMYQDALLYCKDYGVEVGKQLPKPGEKDDVSTGDRKRQYDAAKYMFELKFYRDLSNFPHHYYRAKIESLEKAIAARKLFHQAETAYIRGNLVKARETYEETGALTAWRDEVLLGYVRIDLIDCAGMLGGALASKQVLPGNLRNALVQLLPRPGMDPTAHRFYREDQNGQEFAYETQIRYLQFFTEQYGVRMQKGIVQTAEKSLLPAMPMPAGSGMAYAMHCMVPVIIENIWTPQPIRRIFADLKGPFDICVFDVEDKNQPLLAVGLIGTAGGPFSAGPLLATGTAGAWSKPLISSYTIQVVRERKKLNPPKKPAEEGQKPAKKR